MKRVHRNFPSFHTWCGKTTSIKKNFKKSRFIPNRIVLQPPLSSYFWVGNPRDAPCVWWLSRTTQKTCCSHSYSLLQKRKQIKISPSKSSLRWCLGETRHEFQFPSHSRGVWTALPTPSNDEWMGRFGVGQPGRLIGALCARFLRGVTPVGVEAPRDWPDHSAWCHAVLLAQHPGW